MNFIAHRVNTIAELKKIPVEYGVEVDLREHGKQLILQHEPFKDGENLEEYLKYYKHKIIIFNVKSERIEPRALELIKKYRIKNFFLLDSSFPMIYKLSKEGERNIALRFSEFESIGSILLMKNSARWVWVDCFTRLCLNKKNYKILKNSGFKLCLVSPELQGRPEDIDKYREVLRKENVILDAVCSKFQNKHKWES